MKVFKRSDYDIAKIEFCCGAMSCDILLGRIATRQWTDHPLVFFVGDFKIECCPHCGAKIDGNALE